MLIDVIAFFKEWFGKCKFKKSSISTTYTGEVGGQGSGKL